MSQGNVTTLVGACAAQAIQHFGFKDVEYTTDSGANLTLKYDVSDVRVPIVPVFSHGSSWLRCARFEKGHIFVEFPH